MQIKFLKDVVTIVVGKQAEDIVDLLAGKKNVNEFIIAKKLGITINQTRNILYKLSDQGLVSSIRKKDKKKGWYTYFWKIEIIKSLEFFRDFLKNRINQYSSQIKSRETKLFYVCERCNIEFNEENALINDFICNECGEVFGVKDNSKVLRDFKRELSKLESLFNLVEEEIKKEKEKRIVLEARREAKKKKEKEALRAKARKNVKKKVARKKSIKKVEKKQVKKKVLKKKNSVKKKPIRKIKKKITRKESSRMFKKTKKVVRKKSAKKKR